MPWAPIGEATAIYGCSERTLRRRISTGKLASRRNNGRLLVSIGEIDQEPSRRLAEVSASLAVSSKITADQFATAIQTVQDAGMRAERQAQVARRTTLVATAALVTFVTTAGIGYGILAHRHNQQVATIQGTADKANGLAEARAERISAMADTLADTENDRDHIRDELSTAQAESGKLAGDLDTMADTLADTRRQPEGYHPLAYRRQILTDGEGFSHGQNRPGRDSLVADCRIVVPKSPSVPFGPTDSDSPMVVWLLHWTEPAST